MTFEQVFERCIAEAGQGGASLATIVEAARAAGCEPACPRQACQGAAAGSGARIAKDRYYPVTKPGAKAPTAAPGTAAATEALAEAVRWYSEEPQGAGSKARVAFDLMRLASGATVAEVLAVLKRQRRPSTPEGVAVMIRGFERRGLTVTRSPDDTANGRAVTRYHIAG